MSATINVKRKRKRVKIECLECGSTFDDDFKKKHEKKLHNGKRINVKQVGAPKNPFESAAKTSRLLSKQIKLHNMIPSSSTQTICNVIQTEAKPEGITESVLDKVVFDIKEDVFFLESCKKMKK